MATQQRMTINRLANFSRRFSHKYSLLGPFELEREAHLLRNKLQHLKRNKSISLLIDMMRDLESRRPVLSSKLDRVMINLRELSASPSSKKGGGVEQKFLGQPAIASILLLAQFIKDKSVFR
ncbi:MAG: hypothetical protein ACE5KJ_01000 [Candidatus Zixiibacteriota bacterium]